jgi:hypothetical protein
VADVGFRMHRLSRLEERLVNAALERRLAGSPLAKALQSAQDSLQATRSVAELAEEEVTTPRPGQAVAQIASGLRFVAGLLTKTDIPITVTARFELAMTAVLADADGDVAPVKFHALETAARQAEAALVAKVAELETALAAEREKLADSVLVGDDADARLPRPPPQPALAGARRPTSAT